MARALHKVQKQISKKRSGKSTGSSLHQNSRDAQRLRRAGAREEKLARLMDAATRANQNYVDRVSWFRSSLEGSTTGPTDDEMHLLVSAFISREDEQLADLKAQRRPGRPISKAEERIQQRIDDESREYKSGFWVPNLRDETTRNRLGGWGGSWEGLNTMNFVRVVRDGSIEPSRFPPKGLS